MIILLPIRDAARIYAVPESTIRRWLSTGRLTRHGERKPYLVDLAEIEAARPGAVERQVERAAAQAYAHMIGADLPIEERRQRARNAGKPRRNHW